MSKKPASKPPRAKPPRPLAAGRPSALLDTRVIYCGDNLEQLAKLPEKCIDLIYIDPPFNSNRNYEVSPRRPGLRGPARQHAGVHRLHAAAVCRTGPLQ